MSEEDQTPLSEVFSDSSEANDVIVDDVEETTATAEPEQVEDEPKAEETVEEVAAPTAETVDNTKEANAFKAMALDERTKRQALESQLASLQKPVETPDAFVNPDEAIAHGDNTIRHEFNERFLNMSESQARSRHDDFDSMNDVFFNEMAATNPDLINQANKAPDPYEFVYQQAKTHNEFKGVNSVDDLRSKIEVEIRAKLEAEYADKANVATEKAISNALPQSLSNTTAKGGNTQPEWEGAMPLNKIFGS